MNYDEKLLFELEGYKARKLCLDHDVEDLQKLCESCLDYYELIGNKSVDPFAAKEIFEDLAPGKKYEDKIVIGMYSEDGSIIGVIEGFMDYPEKKTWYIGLMMVAPEFRKRGTGKKFYKGFERWTKIHDVKNIKLGVLEENKTAFAFWGKMGFQTIKKIENYKIGNIETTVSVMNNILK